MKGFCMNGSRKEALENLQTGTYGVEGEKLDWSYYDTAVLAAATQVHRLFTNPLGAGGKTLDFTNLTIAGQIPQGQQIITRAIKVFYRSIAVKATAAVQALYDLFSTTTVQVKLQNKETMGIWTLQELIGSASLFAVTPTVAGDNIPMIQPKFHGIFPLNNPITLAALTPFEVTVSHHSAVDALLAGDHLKIALCGTMIRIS